MKRLIRGLLIGLLFCSGVTAEEYNLYIPNIDNCNNFGLNPATLGNQNLKINYVDFSYDNVANQMAIEVQTDDSRGSIADLFHFVITNGDMPLGEANVAHVYFDATDINNPKVNVFAYNGHPSMSGDVNCNNNPGSWETSNYFEYYAADPIINSNSTSVLEINADEAPGTVTTRTFRLILNTNNINSYQPFLMRSFPNEYPYDYQGVQFGDHIGVWFWAADASSTYAASDFLDSLSMSVCAVCDQENFETKKKPICTNSSSTVNPVEVGQSTTISITINDPDKISDSEQNALTVNYTGLPGGAKPDVPAGSTVNVDASGNATVSITWVPQIGDEGTYNIGANFAKDYGLDQLVANCAGVELKVNPKLPECQKSDNSPITQADADLNNLNRIATVLKTRIKKLRSKVGNKRKVDDINADDIYTQGWTAYWQIANQGDYFFQCTFTEFCTGGVTQVNMASSVATFYSRIDELNTLARARANKFKKALIQHLIQNKGLSKAVAKRRAIKRTKKLWLQGRDNDGIIPSFESAQSLVNLHVNNFGTQRFECVNAKVV